MQMVNIYEPASGCMFCLPLTLVCVPSCLFIYLSASLLQTLNRWKKYFDSNRIDLHNHAENKNNTFILILNRTRKLTIEFIFI